MTLQRYRQLLTDGSDHAYTVLRWSLGITMFLAGLHKLFQPLAWGFYTAGWFTAVWPTSIPAFMLGLGVLEIAVGLAVLADWNTDLIAGIAAASIGVIVINIVTTGRFVDVLIRDLGLFGLGIGVALMAAGRREQDD